MQPEIRAAIARIEVRDGARVLSRGTGFLVTERLLLTAFHVVGDRTRDPPTLYESQYGLFLCFPEGERRGRVVAGTWDPAADWALVESDQPVRGRPLPLAELNGSNATWQSYGFPDANPLDGMVFSGSVENAAGEIQGVLAMQLFSKQAAAGNGSPVRGLSGAPVLVEGAVVGVLRYSLMKEGLNVAGTLYSCPVGSVAQRAAALLPLPDPCWGLPGLPWRDLPPVPYRYLEWFAEGDAEIFFGRNREIRALYERTVAAETPPIVLLYGQSGVGKSSFLAAGVLPRLKRDREVLYVRRDADARLAGSLRAALSATRDSPIAELWRAREAVSGLPLVLLVDQIEEIYTRPSSAQADELQEFFVEIARLFGDPAKRPRGKLVLSFRKEWYPEIRKPFLARGLPVADVFLERLGRDGIIEAVHGLTATRRLRDQYGLAVEPGLAARIADDLLDDRDSAIAPTLQILLTKMWHAATRANASKPGFTLELYQELKEQGLLLRDFLERQLDALAAEDPGGVGSGLALDLLAYHTTPGLSAEERTREQLLRDYRHGGPAMERIVEQLSKLYLLSDSSRDRRDGAQSTRLAHDTLAPPVRRMFARSDRPGQRARRILEGRATDWSEGRDGAPLDERDLAEVERGLPAMRAPSADEQRLLQASVAEHERRDRRRTRRRWVLRGSVAIMLVSLGAAIAALVDASRAKEIAELRSIAAEALATENLEPVNSLVQAIKATGISLRRSGKVSAPVQYSLSTLAENAREQQSFEHGGPIRAIAVSRDGALVASGGDDGRVRVWKLESVDGKPLLEIASHDVAVQSLSFGAVRDGVLATGNRDGTVRLWDRSGNLLRPPIRAHQGSVNAVALAADSQWLASAGDDGVVRLWDRQGAPLATLADATQAAIRSLEISTDGRAIAAGGDDGLVRIWSRNEKWGRAMLGRGHEGRVNAVAFTPDGSRVVSASADRMLRVWNLDGVQQGRTLTGHDSSVNSVAIDPAGGGLITGDEDGSVRRFDWQGNRLGRPFYGPDGPVRSIAYLPAGRTVVMGGSDGTVRVRDFRGTEVGGAALAATRLPMRAVLFAADGQRIAFGGDGARLRIVDFKAWPFYTEVSLPDSPDDRVTALAAIANDPRFIAGDARGAIQFRDWKGAPQGAPLALGAEVSSIATSPDGSRIAVGGADGVIHLLDRQGQPARPPAPQHKGRVSSIAFDPGGSVVTSAGADGKVVFWDLVADTRTEGLAAGRRGVINALVYSPDGEHLAIGFGDGYVQLVGWKGGKATYEEIKAHNGAVRAIAMNRDGSLMATAGDDALVALWSSAGKPLAAFNLRHRGEVTGVAFHPLRNIVASVGVDGSARMFYADWRDWLRIACERLRNHPAMVDPLWIDADAKQTCTEHVWSKTAGVARDALDR